MDWTAVIAENKEDKINDEGLHDLTSMYSMNHRRGYSAELESPPRYQAHHYLVAHETSIMFQQVDDLLDSGKTIDDAEECLTISSRSTRSHDTLHRPDASFAMNDTSNTDRLDHVMNTAPLPCAAIMSENDGEELNAPSGQSLYSNDDLLESLYASLLPPSASATSTGSSATTSTAATTPEYSFSSYSSSSVEDCEAPTSGTESPEHVKSYPSGASTPSRRSTYALSFFKNGSNSTSTSQAPLSTFSPNTTIPKRNKQVSILKAHANSIITLSQAISLSLYMLITLIAGMTLVSILIAGYGLTLADDLKYKIGLVGKNMDRKYKKISVELVEWLKLVVDQLKKQKLVLEAAAHERAHYYPHSTYSSSSASSSTRSTGYKNTPNKRRKHGKRRMSEPLLASLKSSVHEYASLAYQKLPFPSSFKPSSLAFTPSSSTPTSSSKPKKTKSAPSSRPRSRCPSPPLSEYDSPQSFPHFVSSPSSSCPAGASSSSSSSSTSSSSSSSSWTDLPPRPPFSILIPSMVLAILLALLAVFGSNKKTNTKKEEYANQTSPWR